MAEPPTSIDQTPEWQALARHHQAIGDTHLRELFAADPGRGETMTCEAGDLYLDWSKQRVTGETVGLLVALAERAGLRRRIDAMFGGERINVTENRAVLHVALRAPEGSSIEVDGQDVVPGVHEVLGRMRGFADEVRSGRWLGHTGRRVRNVVNIGIGGSDLGPAMAYEALRPYSDRSHDLPVRLQRRRGRHRRGDPRPGPGRDPVRGLLQDLHHHRDPDQRPHGPGLAAGRPRRPGGRVAPLRGRVHQRREGGRVRHRPGQHVRLLGLGRRPLLVPVGDRAVAAGGHRAGPLRRAAGRLPPDGRALPHRPVRAQPARAAGAARRLVHRLLRGRDPGRAPLQPVPGALPGLPPAARHGVQRQVGHPGRDGRSGWRPGRWSGASPAPTASTPSTS